MKPNTTDSKEMITPKQAMNLLGVGRACLTRWKLEALRTPGGHRRFLRSEIMALICHEKRD